MTLPMLNPERIYRVNRFQVPCTARGEFLEQIKNMNALLRQQPGFIQELLLEQEDAQGFSFVAITEWRDSQATEEARAAVLAQQQKTGFNAQAMLSRLGIRAEFASYSASAWQEAIKTPFASAGAAGPGPGRGG